MTDVALKEHLEGRTTIYALCESSGEIRYIGKTAAPLQKRLLSHLSGAKRIANHRTFWLRSLPYPPIIRALCVVSNEHAADMERTLIAGYRARGFRLVNQTDGGEGTPGWKPSAQWHARQRARGPWQRIRPPEWKEHQRQALAGRKLSLSHRAALSRSLQGRKVSAETRAKISAANKGNQNWRHRRRRDSPAQLRLLD